MKCWLLVAAVMVTLADLALVVLAVWWPAFDVVPAGMHQSGRRAGAVMLLVVLTTGSWLAALAAPTKGKR